MTIQCKTGAPVNSISIYCHVKCLILTVKNKNHLYEFEDGDKLLNDLKLYLTIEDVIKVKEFIEVNSAKAKFSEVKPPEDNQLSLF